MSYKVLPDTDEMETFIFAEDRLKLQNDNTAINDVIDVTPISNRNSMNAYSLYLKYKKNTPMKINKKKEKKRKKNKKNKKNSELPCILPRDVLGLFEQQAFYEQRTLRECHNAPDSMLFDPYHESAFFFGKSWGGYVGKHQDTDGHIAVFGGSGSGKSSCLAIPTTKTWRGPIFAIDFKGELVVAARKRNPKVLNMLKGQRNSYWYNPFYFMSQDDNENLVQNARELAQAIIPLPNNIDNPFWIMSARDILTGAIIYYFDIGTEFIDAMIEIKTTPMLQLLKKIGLNETAKACVNPDLELSPKMLAGVSAELHNYIAVFATDTLIQEVLSPTDDSISNSEIVKWNDLEDSDIFIRVDHSKIRQWGSVIRMMLTQLIRTLERRPEKYNHEGVNLKPILLILDEFPQYGNINVITSALATLRSKNITIAIFNQSLADLDAIYGKDIRRIILDNCPYKAILNASDAETQRYFSDLIGTSKVPAKGISVSYDEFGQPLGYSANISQALEFIVHPHELASLPDIMLLHPRGFSRIEKLSCYNKGFNPSGLRIPVTLLEETPRGIGYVYKT